MKFYVIVASCLLLSSFLIPLSFYDAPLPVGAGNPISPALLQSGAPPSAEVSQKESPAPQTEPESPYYTDTGGDYISVLDTGSGKVLKVSWRDYVRGALCSEMPPSFHPEALKAQAVAAHTYAMYSKKAQLQSPDPALKGADIAANPGVFAGFVTEKHARERFGDSFELYWGMICSAADAVLPYVLLYEDEPIIAAYHSISAGFTEDASNVWSGCAPYLVPVQSEGDILSPSFETAAEFTASEAKALLTAEYPDMELSGSPESWFGDIGRSPSGYVTSVEIGGITLHGKDVRRVFSLRSSHFTPRFTDTSLSFTVQGYGHGVGLSQYGADYMARQGASFDEILAHYYPGTRLGIVPVSGET